MLRYRADLRPLAFQAIYFGLFAYAMFWLPWSWWALPVTLGLCLFAFTGAVQTHNAVHSPIFRARWLNKLYQVGLTLTYGHPVSSYVPGHNLSHHKHTQTGRDIMRTSKASFRWHLLNLFGFFFRIAPATTRADIQYIAATRHQHPRWFRQLLFEAGVLVLVTGVLLYLDWVRAVLFWVVPHLYAQWGIVTMNLLQHDGCDQDHAYNHSRNFVSPLLNWWTMNNGYHGIHHERPGTHWSRLPELHARLYQPHVHPALDEPSMIAYVWRTFVLNRRIDYLGRPVPVVPPGRDEPWIPRIEEIPDDLGAERLPT
ncbi:MAG: fatty acid desaturase [Myxococcales bacterium FL481]|nr:MAG: fatty acid desaturase [Myxococcales bacterium FL481]